MTSFALVLPFIQKQAETPQLTPAQLGLRVKMDPLAVDAIEPFIELLVGHFVLVSLFFSRRRTRG